MLLMLLAVADLGRLFSSGIVVQAASRDGAEAAAQAYVQLSQSTTMSATDFYTAVRAKGEAVTCAEAQRLGGTSVDGSGNCTDPAIAICVHDAGVPFDGVAQSGDPNCGQSIGAPTAGEVAACSSLTSAWTTQTDAAGLPYVEVRICYPFSMLTQTQFLPVGPFYLQQSSNFVAAIY